MICLLLSICQVKTYRSSENHSHAIYTASYFSLVFYLQNSELPERRKLWDGIYKFNKSDPSVLSSDPAEQIRKVRGGNYAFIGERTYLDMAIGQSCDMSVISTEDFHPLLIALPLPNNSPFLKVFSNE